MTRSGRTQTESEAGAGPSSAETTLEPHLFLVIEGARPLAGGSRHSLELIDEVIFARTEQQRRSRRAVEAGARRLFLEVPDARMSSQHARLFREGSRWIFEDTGSRNGSRIDGERIESAELTDGATPELGRTFFLFRSSVPVTAIVPGDESTDPATAGPLATLLPRLDDKLQALARIADRSTVPILLLGETGTGKEVLARALHEASGRSGAFVAVNCGALTQTLVESQLFGHTKGAFSGAERNEVGFVRAAHQGTLFLDEVGDLPLHSQAALLRVLQERSVTPVGSTASMPVDIRVVSATHVPLAERVEKGTFRADLFARLAGYSHHLHPLRERREDLGLLTSTLLRRLDSELTLATDACRAMLRYDWPLNVRELQHALAVAAALSPDGNITAAHLPQAITSARRASDQAKPQMDDAQLEAQLRQLFREHRGNVSQVARAMGRARNQVQRWMKRFQIDRDEFDR